MASELKPCPFCGADLVMAHSFSTRQTQTFCHPVLEDDTICMGGSLRVIISSRSEDQESIAAWNRRAIDPATIRADALREAAALVRDEALGNVAARKRIVDAIEALIPGGGNG